MDTEIKENLFYALKELHTVERINKMNLKSFSSFVFYRNELIQDIYSLISELAVIYDEVDLDFHQICMWDFENSDSKTSRVVGELYHETKHIIETQWKSVV